MSGLSLRCGMTGEASALDQAGGVAAGAALRGPGSIGAAALEGPGGKNRSLSRWWYSPHANYPRNLRDARISGPADPFRVGDFGAAEGTAHATLLAGLRGVGKFLRSDPFGRWR